jgi:prophage antirepressor-like protein
MEVLPVLAEKDEVQIVEVDGQPVVTARALGRALGYANPDKAISKIYMRNRDSFTERDTFVIDLRGVHPQPGGEPRNKESFTDRDTFVIKLMTNPQGGDPHVRVFTKRGALKVCMKSNQPRAVQVQEMLIDLFEMVERGGLASVAVGSAMARLAERLERLERGNAGLLVSEPVVEALRVQSHAVAEVARAVGQVQGQVTALARAVEGLARHVARQDGGAGLALAEGGLLDTLAGMQKEIWLLAEAQGRLEERVERLSRRRSRRRSGGAGIRACDQEALRFIRELFATEGFQSVAALIRKVQAHARERGWRIGSRATMYRIAKSVRRARVGHLWRVK